MALNVAGKLDSKMGFHAHQIDVAFSRWHQPGVFQCKEGNARTGHMQRRPIVSRPLCSSDLQHEDLHGSWLPHLLVWLSVARSYHNSLSALPTFRSQKWAGRYGTEVTSHALGKSKPLLATLRGLQVP